MGLKARGWNSTPPPTSNITQASLPEKDTTPEIGIVCVLTRVMALCVLIMCRVFTYELARVMYKQRQH